MKLEDEIKQERFKSEYHKLAVNLIFTSNWLVAHHNKHLKQFNLTPEQFNLLRILRGQYPKPVTVNLIIDRMLNKMSNASRLVEKLRKKGLVGRQTNDDDRRACDVQITNKGLKVLAELDKEEKELNKLVHGISNDEARKLNLLLDKMRD